MSFYLVAGQGGCTDTAEHLPTARARRYPSDTSDAEWQVLAEYLPASGQRGRSVTYPRRAIVDAIRYLDHNSCLWRALPVDFPPSPTVYHCFRTWPRDGTSSSLRERCPRIAGRYPTPTRRSWTPKAFAPSTPTSLA